jgi:hypothetical protein
MTATAKKTDPLDLLAERSRAMARRVLSGDVDFIDAVDACYSVADWAGLVRRYGDDLIQAALAEAFMNVPRKGERHED